MARPEHIQDFLSTKYPDRAGKVWFKWKKNDDSGNPIPPKERMTYENLEILAASNTSTYSAPLLPDNKETFCIGPKEEG